jgi:hypothetical protein
MKSNHEERLKEDRELLDGMTFSRWGLDPQRRGRRFIRVGDPGILTGESTSRAEQQQRRPSSLQGDAIGRTNGMAIRPASRPTSASIIPSTSALDHAAGRVRTDGHRSSSDGPHQSRPGRRHRMAWWMRPEPIPIATSA